MWADHMGCDMKNERLKGICKDIMTRLKDLADSEGVFLLFIAGVDNGDGTMSYADFSNADDKTHRQLLKSTSDDHEDGRAEKEDYFLTH